MHLDELPNELLLHIYQSATSIPDALALAATNRHLHRVFAGSQKLPILFGAAERQLGPLRDAVQLVTHNSRQPPHLARADRVPYSLALLRQLLPVGAVANRWAALYPLHRWRRDFEGRRPLRADEARRLRRAVYRVWLYGRAFHTSQLWRAERLRPDLVAARAALLRRWPPAELAELEDVRGMLRNVLRWRVCPSNGTVLRRYRRRYHLDGAAGGGDDAPSGDDDEDWWGEHGGDYGLRNNAAGALDQSLAGLHRAPGFPAHHDEPLHNAPTVGGPWSRAHYNHPGAAKTAAPAKGDAAALAATEGWGDEVLHYYVLEDMLKLDPAQILFLRDRAPGRKPLVERFVHGLGEWFDNNGETLGQTLQMVLVERGDGDLDDLREELERRVAGIALD